MTKQSRKKGHKCSTLCLLEAYYNTTKEVPTIDKIMKISGLSALQADRYCKILVNSKESNPNSKESKPNSKVSKTSSTGVEKIKKVPKKPKSAKKSSSNELNINKNTLPKIKPVDPVLIQLPQKLSKKELTHASNYNTDNKHTETTKIDPVLDIKPDKNPENTKDRIIRMFKEGKRPKEILTTLNQEGISVSPTIVIDTIEKEFMK